MPFLTAGKGVDLGCGPQAILPWAVTVDHDPSHGATYARDISGPLPLRDMDWVFSSHALEDLPEWKAALANWWGMVKQGGHLILYLPHKWFYPNVGQPGANPGHFRDFLPEDVLQVMRQFRDARLRVCSEHDENDEYSFFIVYQKTSPPPFG
ncbi:MAG: class I SAM-dependent methyltransferase [Proteobacteria bacterium]|nr:class I SAM-dependent methyltransferase [Pseudomonadota bacterium]